MHKISYTADGVSTEFEFSFPFFQAADVRVMIDGDIIGSDKYSVVENTDFSGGRVVFAMAPTVDTHIDIYRMVALTRVIDYQPTAKIDPEHLNSDFNFILEAFRDLHAPNIDIEQWRTTHTNMVAFLEYTNDLIADKMSGGGVLGIYKNLITVLDNALPNLINDYGEISDATSDEECDDYGIL
ncbi:MAG: hypothetical protein J6L70_00400 [Alphaproteobacteria bacterium]|nr:hypothetical protein [Alphaproteobacteria bacterium]